jgi:hypothetical protein
MARLRSKFVWTGIFLLSAVLTASARRLMAGIGARANGTSRSVNG